MIPNSELIINPDGSIYHLGLLPSQVPDHIITVGDPDRVDKVTDRFDKIDFTRRVREFKSTLGTYKGTSILVISTGIGTDNIDIVFTELDACVNIDFERRENKDQLKRLNFYRIGTSGSLTQEIPIGSLLISSFAIGLGGMMNFYEYEKHDDIINYEQNLREYLMDRIPHLSVYIGKGDNTLIDSFVDEGLYTGITLTAPGFYGPQGRSIRIPLSHQYYFDVLQGCNFGDKQITNLEMETAGIYAMANALGHRAISLNALLANRKTGEFTSQPEKIVSELIDLTLDKIVSNF